MVKKSILILSPFFRPNIGGVETHLDDLCEYLRGHDFKVYVLTYNPVTTKAKWSFFEKIGDLEILRIPWIGFNLFHKLEPYPILEFLYITPWLFIWTFVFLMSKGKDIQVIHAQGFNASFMARLLTKIFKKRFIVSTHAIYGMKSGSLIAKMVKWTLKSTNKVLALSNASKRELMEIGLQEDKIDTYTYWVDQSVFKPFDKVEAKKKVNWQGKFVVLFVGRFIEIKGMDLLLEVAKDIDEGIYFAFIGDGPLSSVIKEASTRLSNTIFIGKIDNHNLPLYYSAAEIVCVPSKYDEGFGRVIIESLSCGTPVLASNRGGIPEAIDERVGVLIEPTVDNLKHQIEFLYRKPERLHKMQSQCREYALNRFSERNIEHIIASYDGQ